MTFISKSFHVLLSKNIAYFSFESKAQ